MAAKVKRVRVARDFPTTDDAVTPYCNGIITACTNNKWLPTPNPVLANLETVFAPFPAAQVAAKTKAAGAATIRDELLDQVKLAVESLANQVQAAADANPSQASAIIVGCGFHIAGAAVRTKKEVSAKAPAAGGTAVLDVLAVVGAICYFWQMSLDKTTWTDCLPTKGSKTTITGLTSGTKYYFRFRCLIKDGYTPWSVTFSVDVL
jgi:hypothetical protein